jgi:dipeptidyl aminopeptidase/acylaminoacyl peptidase
MKYTGVFGAVLALSAASALAESVTRTEANNGNLIMEDVPPIPAKIVDDLNRYQNVRSGNLQGWQEDSAGPYISTRFADVDQLHRVDAPGGARLLAMNYVSITDSRAHLVDLDSGAVTLLAGGPGKESANNPVGFDDGSDGYWLITSRGSEFQRLAWQPLAAGADVEVVTDKIHWDVTGAVISEERERMAFVVNKNGRSAIYLFDPRTREYRFVDNIPTGVLGNIGFSPDGRKLVMTLSTVTTPSDTFVLELGPGPLDHGPQARGTFSEIGGLDAATFREPDLISYPTFDEVGGSYGGYIVLASAVHYSDRLKAAVDIVGISSFVTFLENTQDYRRDLRRVEYGDQRDTAMRAHLQKISPLNNVDKISVPMFVVQGENDPRVPLTEATQMVAALREQGSTVWYMNALNDGHGYRKKENRDLFQQATVFFLQQYLVGRE